MGWLIRGWQYVPNQHCSGYLQYAICDLLLMVMFCTNKATRVSFSWLKVIAGYDYSSLFCDSELERSQKQDAIDPRRVPPRRKPRFSVDTLLWHINLKELTLKSQPGSVTGSPHIPTCAWVTFHVDSKLPWAAQESQRMRLPAACLRSSSARCCRFCW